MEDVFTVFEEDDLSLKQHKNLWDSITVNYNELHFALFTRIFELIFGVDVSMKSSILRYLSVGTQNVSIWKIYKTYCDCSI